MKRDDVFLGIYTLDGSIAVGIPLLRFGYRDFVEDELRSRDELTDEQAVHFCVTIIIDTCAGTISSGNEIVCHEGIEFRQSLGRYLALSISKLQPFQQSYHILEGNLTFSRIVYILAQHLLFERASRSAVVCHTCLYSVTLVQDITVIIRQSVQHFDIEMLMANTSSATISVGQSTCKVVKESVCSSNTPCF